MRLFLSSYRAGKHPDKMIKFFGRGSRIGVITNAKDYKFAKQREKKVEEVLEYFRLLGMKPTEIDLRDYFGKPEEALKLMKGFPVIWGSGGNTFLLRRALKQAGVDRELAKLVKEEKIIYGGESAGAILPGPTLRGAEDDRTREDNPMYIPRLYDREVIWEGLKLVSFVPLPHYKGEYYGEMMDKLVESFDKQKIRYKTIREDQVLIIDGRKTEILR